MTSREKIDQMLGISPDQSVDEYLDEMTMSGNFNALSSTLDTIKDGVEKNAATVDEIMNSQTPMLQISTLEHSMKEIEDLVALSKNMFKHVYEQIVTSSLLDSEAISAAAKLLESIHINIAEFISVYQSKMKFYELLQKMAFQHKCELLKMDHKHELDMQKMKARMDMGAQTVAPGSFSSTFEDMINAIQKAEENDTQIEVPFEEPVAEVNSDNDEIKEDEKLI